MKPQYHIAKTILAPLSKLRADGFNSAQALAGTGLSLSILERPEERVGLSQELQFLRNLRRITKDPNIGLYVGECYPLSVFGLYGYAMMSASTVGEALKIGYGYVELSFAYFEHTLRKKRDKVRMCMWSDEYSEDDMPMLTEREMMTTLMILRGVAGNDVELHSVNFNHQALGPAKDYERRFNCPVIFGSNENSIEFDASVLDKPLMQCDSGTAAMCLDRCQRLKAQMYQHGNIVHEVNELLMLRPGIFPTIEEVSEHLNMSSRTLRRRLREHNLGYRQLVDQLRFNLAQEYLLTTDISVQQISSLLGYSDAAHFSNAFKRWSGMSPIHFKNLGLASVA